jgi:leucine dehydrogenase
MHSKEIDPSGYSVQRIAVDRYASLLVVKQSLTTQGPANGGLRIRAYPSRSDAHLEGLRLAQRMTLKHAVHATGFSGAKLVAHADPRRVDRARLLAVVAKTLDDHLGDLYTGCDLNTTAGDMKNLHALSPYVLAAIGSAIDPSYATARGVFGSIRGVLDESGQSDTFLVHGTGQVGAHVARILAAMGGTVYTYDLDPTRADIAGCHNISRIRRWWEVPAETLVLCSISGIIDPGLAGMLQCRNMISCANCPFTEAAVEEIIRERTITWVPDFISSAGAVISDSIEYYNPEAFRSALPEEIYAFVERTVHKKTKEYLTGACAGAFNVMAMTDGSGNTVCGLRFAAR